MREYVVLGFLAWSATFLPAAFPLALANVFLLLGQWYDPYSVLLWAVVWSLIGDAFLRYIDPYLIGAVNRIYRVLFNKKEQFNKEEKHQQIQNMQPTSRFWKRMKKAYLSITDAKNSWILFVAVAFTTYVAIPDILIITLVRQRKSMLFFMLAAFTWKFALYAGYALGVVWISSLF